MRRRGDIQTRLRGMSKLELMEVSVLVEELLQAEESPVDPKETAGRVVMEKHTAGGVTLQLEKVKCGKAGCKSCPHPKHGAGYWYAYWRESGKVKSKYIGRSKALAFQYAEKKTEEGRKVGGKDTSGLM